MNIFTGKYSAACLLLYAGVLSIVVFWQKDNIVIGTLAILAAIGWLAWWIERYVLSDAARLQFAEGAASTVCAPSSSVLIGQEPERAGGGPAQAQVTENARVSGQISHMAAQVRVTVEEAEQAIAVSIKAFNQIMAEANEAAQYAHEMMNCSSEKSPLIHSAFVHLSEKSEHITCNAQQIVMAFQFQDLLRQRLEYIAAYLDTMPDADANGQDTSLRTIAKSLEESRSQNTPRGVSLPSATFSYAPKPGDQTNVTLF